MSGAGRRGGEGLEGRVRAAADVAARLRRDLGRDEAPELRPLLAAIEAIDDAPDRRASAREVRGALLALVDEIGALADELRRRRAEVGARLSSRGTHRRAGAAYRRAGGR